MYAGRTLGLTPRLVAVPYVLIAPTNLESRARGVATRKLQNNYGHTDETKARLREATTRAIAEGRISPVSALEDKVAIELERRNVSFVRQHAIRGNNGQFVACIDFMLDDGRALEVNGTFWHSDPRVFPEGPMFPAQRRTEERWVRKVVAMELLGIPLIVLWEQDIRDDLAHALNVALATI